MEPTGELEMAVRRWVTPERSCRSPQGVSRCPELGGSGHVCCMRASITPSWGSPLPHLNKKLDSMLFRHGLIFTFYESVLPPYRCLVMGKSRNESEKEEGRGMQEGGVAVSGGIRTEEGLWHLLFCVARGG